MPVLVTPLGGSTAASAIQTSSVEIIAINAASIATSVTPISNRLRRLQQTTSVCDGLQTASSFPISIPILGLSLVEWCYDDLNTGLLHTGACSVIAFALGWGAHVDICILQAPDTTMSLLQPLLKK